jgi:hypothetical protein
MLPLKGGPNGSKEVIHAKNSRGPQAESRGVELSGNRPDVNVKYFSYRYDKDISHPCGKQLSHPPLE